MKEEFLVKIRRHLEKAENWYMSKCQRFSFKFLSRSSWTEYLLGTSFQKKKKKILKKSASHLIRDSSVSNKEICPQEFHVLKDLFWRCYSSEKSIFKKDSLLNRHSKYIVAKDSTVSISPQFKVNYKTNENQTSCVWRNLSKNLVLNPVIHENIFKDTKTRKIIKFMQKY